MQKADHYYFTDSLFQLELNLHNIRRELILMIEEFEKQDCFVCWQLKCCCQEKPTETQTDSGRVSRTSHTSPSVTKNKETVAKRAPPAESLPKPQFENESLDSPGTSSSEGEVNKDIEAWFDITEQAQNAAGVENEKRMNATDALLATLKKSWNDGRVDDLKKEKMMTDPRYASTANAVETFFKSFKVQPISMTPANIAYITNRLTAAFVKQKVRKAEYSYF